VPYTESVISFDQWGAVKAASTESGQLVLCVEALLLHTCMMFHPLTCNTLHIRTSIHPTRKHNAHTCAYRYKHTCAVIHLRNNTIHYTNVHPLYSGQVPCWSTPDGLHVSQSNSILRHQGRTLSLYGGSIAEAATVDMALVRED
jgi:hypothetical protein